MRYQVLGIYNQRNLSYAIIYSDLIVPGLTGSKTLLLLMETHYTAFMDEKGRQLFLNLLINPGLH